MKHNKPGETHWHIISHFFVIRLFLLVSIALTVTHTNSACNFDFGVGWINLGTIGETLTSHCSGCSGSSMPLSGCMSDSTTAVQSSPLSFGLSTLTGEFSQFSVFKMGSGALSSSLLMGWCSILQIGQTFSIYVHPPGKFFADKAGCKGDLSDNSNAAAPSCSNSEKDTLTISSISEMYHMAVSSLYWARDSICVARRFWRPCYISKTS